MPEHILYVSDEDEGKRLDNFLVSYFNKPRNQIQNLIKNNKISVNNKIAKPSYIIKENDTISSEFSENIKELIIPENIPLEIIYENQDILVVNKPKNMLTHPTSKELTGTLVNALLNKYGYEGLSNDNGELRPGIVHRLDRNTSGLLMIAKSHKGYKLLTEQIKNKTAIRQYVAIVHGNFDKTEGTIITKIGRNKNKPEKMAVTDDGKNAITHYKVLEQFKGYSLVELTLETGRTHQIRVHLNYIGHSIINDSLYDKTPFKVKTTEQVLEAYKLTFTPDEKSDKISLEIPYDNDIIKVLNYLRSKK